MPAIMEALGGAALAAETKGLRIYNVPKFTGFIFFELAKAGSQKACDELGCQLTYVGTTTADVEGQVQVYQNILPQKPDGIVTAALDINAPVPALSQARQRGAVVVTFDADVAPKGHARIGSRQCAGGRQVDLDRADGHRRQFHLAEEGA